MTWHPLGPDFVFAPKHDPFKRLSRRNEYGRQGLVSYIAVDPTDAQTLYIAERPSSGGTSAFRTRDGGLSWTPLADSLQRVDPNVDPVCFAVNPDHPERIYMGTYGDSGVFVSTSRGDPGSWSARNAVPGNVRLLIVDPRTSATPATTVLYAATTTGVYRSPDGGTTWSQQVLAGDVWTLVAHMPPTGTAHFYAGVRQQGVFHTTDPTTAWTNLNAQGIGLPAYTPATTSNPQGSFDTVFVDLVRRAPDRVYAWLTNYVCDSGGANCSQVTTGIYTTSASTTSWTQIPVTTPPGPPGPGQGLYAWSFAVTPNSPGDGNNDVLLFGSLGVQRSIDSGRTWQNDGTWFHADQHAIAFWPPAPPAGTIPRTYIGNDGGIAVSTKFADPTVNVTAAPADYNEGFGFTNTYAWQNLDHGKQSSAVYQYNADAANPALSYIGCQDTGIAAGDSALGWRGIADADGGANAAAAGPNGVDVWASLGYFGGWAGFRILHTVDHGELAPSFANATSSGSMIAGSSNYVADLGGECLAGGDVQDANTTLSSAITAMAAAQAATVGSTANVLVGQPVTMEPGTANEETVYPSAKTATTFTAAFGVDHPAGSTVAPHRNFVFRIDRTAAATPISQSFRANGGVRAITRHPTDANQLACFTNDGRVWSTNVGSTAGPATVWTEAAASRPANPWIVGHAIAADGKAYVLLEASITVGAVTTPLFEVSTGTWLPQTVAGLPAGNFAFGKLVADPVTAGTLYAANGARVYSIALAGASWTFTDISAGLPGQWIYDLWTGTVGGGRAQKVLLRAAIPTRSIWELDVTPGAEEPALDLYVRDNFLDTGHLTPSLEGMQNPYNPTDPSDRVWHYQCADIKIDARQNAGSPGGSPFFQTDPESSTLPISHVIFDALRDNSQNLPQNDAAIVHAQVRNRSATAANGVRVWAVYCRAASPLPLFSQSPSQGNAFAFWDQFEVDGTITPNLPADSPWKSVGGPITLNGIDDANPQVASWNWAVPTLPTGDPGHYCMAVLVHSGLSGVGETTRMQIDEIAPTNRQVGQRNVHIGPPLPPSPVSEARGSPGSGAGGRAMEEYVEFHNPTRNQRKSDLLLDLRGLPPALGVTFRLSETGGTAALEGIDGVAASRTEAVPDRWRRGVRRSTSTGLLALLKRLLCLLLNFVRRLFGRHPRPCGAGDGRPLPPLQPTVYEADPGALVRIRGVEIPPLEFCAALLRVEVHSPLEPGSGYRFEVQQEVQERVIGGCTYIVSIGGEPKERPAPFFAPSHDPDLTPEERKELGGHDEPGRFVPPGAEEIIERRLDEQEKR